jgi:hypothetical protein
MITHHAGENEKGTKNDEDEGGRKNRNGTKDAKNDGYDREEETVGYCRAPIKSFFLLRSLRVFVVQIVPLVPDLCALC